MPTLSFSDFSGGLWIPGEFDSIYEQPFTVPANALRIADNLEYLPSGGIIGRRGYRVLETLEGPIVALARYYPRLITGTQIARYKVATQYVSTGTLSWQNLNGILEPADNEQAKTLGIATPGVETYELRLQPFSGLTPIPHNATITRLQVRVLRRQTTGTSAGMETLTVLLYVGGVVQTGNPADVGTKWLQSDFDWEEVIYGDQDTPLNVWDYAVTAADWNTSNLIIAFQAIAVGVSGNPQIDLIELSCVYTTPGDPEDETLIGVTSGGALTYYRRGSGAASAITYAGGSLVAPTRRPKIIMWPEKNNAYIVDGVNPMLQYDGNQLQDVPTDQGEGDVVNIAPRKGPYMCLYKNQLLATEPDEIGFSVYVSDINDPTRWRGILQVSANDSRGGELTGLEAVGNVVVIFKDTALFNLIASGAGLEFGAQLAEFSNVGCVAPDSIQVTPDGIVYLARDGLYITDGQTSQPVEVSKPIRTVFTGRTTETTYSDAVGVYFGRKRQYYLCLAQDALETWVLHKVVIPTEGGDQVSLAWSRIPTELFNAGCTLQGQQDDGDLLLGTSGGELREFDYGTTDNGLTVQTLIKTTERLMAPTRQMGRANEVRPIWRSSVPLDLMIRYDQALSDDVELLSIGANTINPTYQEPRRYIKERTKFGRFVAFTLSSEEGPDFELHRIDVDVRLRGLTLWR